jgi:KDO2-lipid IV(A) lauroyltransferase
MQKTFKFSDLYWALIWAITKISYLIVPVPLLFLFVNVKGYVLSFISPKRAKVRESLSSFFGDTKSEKELRVIARRYFQYMERLNLSLLWPKIQGFAWADKCAIEGLQHLEAALAQGKGAILLTSHFGYSRLIKPLLKRKNHKVWLVGPQNMQDNSEPWSKFADFAYNKLLKMPVFSLRENNDLPTTLNVRPLVQVLQRNEILVLTADGLRASNLVPVKIGPEMVPFAAGSVSLARGTGTMILPTFVVDSGKGLIGLKMVIGKPLELQHSRDQKDDFQVNLERFGRIFEDLVYRYPQLYRWKKPGFFKRRLERLDSDVADRYLGGLSKPKKRKTKKKKKWKSL